MISNLHIYILAAPLLTSFFIGIFGRNNRDNVRRAMTAIKNSLAS